MLKKICFAAPLLAMLLCLCGVAGRNGIIILELNPRDSSTVTIYDTICATIDYE
jgi:hypothetical protein